MQSSLYIPPRAKICAGWSVNKIKTIIGRLSRSFSVADSDEIASKITFAIRHADETYDEAFGLTYAEYSKLCVRNLILHICRDLKKEAKRNKESIHLDAPIPLDERHIFADLIASRKFNAKTIIDAVAFSEALGKLDGLRWLEATALVAGFSTREIARRLGIAASTLSRQLGPTINRMREEIRHG